MAGRPRPARHVNSLTGRTYTPEFRTNLATGNHGRLTGYSGPATNGPEISVTDLNATEVDKFYRIRISYP
jgi:hypothetical protein